MHSRPAIQASGIVVFARSSCASLTFFASPLRRSFSSASSQPICLSCVFHQTLRPDFHCLLHRLTKVAGSRTRVHLVQQLLAKLLTAQKPTSLHRLKLSFQILPPS